MSVILIATWLASSPFSSSNKARSASASAAGRHKGHLFIKGQNVAVVKEDEMVQALVDWAKLIDADGVEAALARADAGAAAEAEADRALLLDEKGDDANQVAIKITDIRKH